MRTATVPTSVDQLDLNMPMIVQDETIPPAISKVLGHKLKPGVKYLIFKKPPTCNSAMMFENSFV